MKKIRVFCDIHPQEFLFTVNREESWKSIDLSVFWLASWL
jgi:hypothetical protein